MKKYNEIFGFSRDEDYVHVNFIRVVSAPRSSGNFDFIKNKNEKLDQKVESLNKIIYYVPCKAKYGDTVYFVFDYNVRLRTRLKMVFKDPIEAIKYSLRDWGKRLDGVIYEVVKVKIEPHMCIGTPTEYGLKNHKLNDFFDAKGPYTKKISTAWRSEKENNPEGKIDIDQEYGQHPEIKNLLLSLNTINKFKF